MAHWRNEFYKTLDHKACLEIGALNSPANLNHTNHIDYLDCADYETLKTRFHEVSGIVRPNYIVDVFTQPLPFPPASYDVVIMNHVIEHIKNPIKVIFDCFNVLKDQGLLIISCPDKRYTFDSKRELTNLLQIVDNYRTNNSIPVVEDYNDFILHVSKSVANHNSDDRLQESLDRKEHIYTYTDESFKKLMLTVKELGILDIVPIYEVNSDVNHFEYFGVWRINKC
jgi:SAM-dependent methyltransferase